VKGGQAFKNRARYQVESDVFIPSLKGLLSGPPLETAGNRRNMPHIFFARKRPDADIVRRMEEERRK
jgi:hypothetical protein